MAIVRVKYNKPKHYLARYAYTMISEILLCKLNTYSVNLFSKYTNLRLMNGLPSSKTLLLFNYVFGDGGTTIVLGSIPFQIHTVHIPVNNLRHAWLAWRACEEGHNDKMGRVLLNNGFSQATAKLLSKREFNTPC